MLLRFARRLLAVMTVMVCTVSIHAAAASSADDSWNVRTNLLSLLFGTLNLRLDDRLNESWMFGPQAQLLNEKVNGVDVRAGSIGMGAVYFFNGTFVDGPYADFGVSVARFRASGRNAQGEERHAEATNTSFKALGGYHWFSLPFNWNVGAGVATNSIRRIAITDTNGSEVNHLDVRALSLQLEMSVGYAF